MAIVGVAYGKIQSTKDESTAAQDAVNELISQVEIIRSKVFMCAAIYPNGDHGEFNARHAYPAPAAASSYRATLTAVECPGSTQTNKTLANLGDGLPIPTPPKDFQAWTYEHTLADGIRLRLSPNVSNGASVIRTRLLRQLGNNASLDGDTVVVSVLL